MTFFWRSKMTLPSIIQGGMGVAISDWRLARAVSLSGQLGVVSGTGISRVMTCRLMDGDLAGNIRRALSNFAYPDPIQSILDRFFIPGGKSATEPYKSQSIYTIHPSKFLDQLTAIANYVEVFLAKENHDGLIGINLLEKVQMPNLASLYGAMLAGVDYVLMGAGIPTQIAAILDKFADHEPVSYRLDVQGALPEDDIRIHFDPEKVFPGVRKLIGRLKRPNFLPIISSSVLGQALIKRSEGAIQGFVVEGHTAGGHNAPPRGKVNLNSNGEPIYGEKDLVDLEKIKQLNVPFWLAGGYGHPDRLKDAVDAGAVGIQVGTAFALCEESGMQAALKERLLGEIIESEVPVFTDPTASPTGFPFKTALLRDTLSEDELYKKRKRICDISLLRNLFKKDDGSTDYRCPAEPVDDYIRKGGKEEDTVDRTCLCNNLLSAAGFSQVRHDGYVEPPLVTAGDDLLTVKQFMKAGKSSYTAKDVIRFLLGSSPADDVQTREQHT
jgi:nitronate monooxygenase